MVDSNLQGASCLPRFLTLKKAEQLVMISGSGKLPREKVFLPRLETFRN
jgi:hypothetical protein